MRIKNPVFNKSIDYILNYELAQKCKDEISKFELFVPKKFEFDDIIENNNFEQCKDFAFEQEHDDEEICVWSDLKENQMADILAEVYKHENYKEINKEVRDISVVKH